MGVIANESDLLKHFGVASRERIFAKRAVSLEGGPYTFKAVCTQEGHRGEVGITIDLAVALNPGLKFYKSASSAR